MQIVIKFEEFFLFSNCYYVSPDLFFQICQRSSLGVIYGDSALRTLIIEICIIRLSLYTNACRMLGLDRRSIFWKGIHRLLSHFLLTLSLPDPFWVDDDTDLLSDSNILKMVRVNIALQEHF